MNNFSKLVRVDDAMADALFGSSVRNGPAGAERELMLAVLSDAIECYWKYQKSVKRSALRLYLDAKKWIFSDKDSLPFSFQDVCQNLELDPSYIRRGILTGNPIVSLSEHAADRSEKNGLGSNIKRRLKSGQSWKSQTRLSRTRVRPLRVGPRG